MVIGRLRGRPGLPQGVPADQRTAEGEKTPRGCRPAYRSASQVVAVPRSTHGQQRVNVAGAHCGGLGRMLVLDSLDQSID
jgi:hypothetical protein